MPVSDAFVVGDDFISEHYFTTDARNESFAKLVADRRKSFDAADHATSRSRFTAARGDLATVLADLYADQRASVEAAAAVYDEVLRILGYTTGPYSTRTEGPVTWYSAAGITGSAPLAVVRATPAATVEDLFARGEGEPQLLEPWQFSESSTETSVSKAVSRLFTADEAVDFVLVLAGRWVLVTQASRWAEGRYLAVDVQTVCDRNDTKRGGEIDRMLTILEADSLAPDADGAVWWASTLEASVKHTVGVSKDLREGVRRSIEIIANEVVARRHARGLPPLPADQAEPLARQSLRFLYRILFLLYAEASPELGVLPVGATEYDTGYSLDRLRELTLVELTAHHAQHGTHFYASLDVLFRLVDTGHHPQPTDHASHSGDTTDGLVFHALRADLFAPAAIGLIAETKLGNVALQQVLRHLLLSKEQSGRDRGFISYVDLGINQLGAVYEGLMSYTGFFATTDLYEVARGGNPEKGSWVVPTDRAQGIDESDFVRRADPVTGEMRPVIHERGQFVYRLSGRARQQSASYYTPEVLTQFTVGQALAELLDQDGQTTTAEDVLGLSVCEPALGSGAFAIEAVNQLATEYLTRRQAELGETIAPEDYQAELRRVKAYLALHNVYGVDLNATAVEFAEITLWLATMAPGLSAPWFGLHLRRGNSLIGARRAVYSRSAVTSKAWLTQPAEDVPLTDLARRIETDDTGPTNAAGRIHHFLLPAAGWGATVGSKEAQELAPERVKAVKAWRGQLKRKPSNPQVDQLLAIAAQTEELWTLALRRLTVANQQSRREIPLWGREGHGLGSVVTREQIEASLADPNGAYRRLKLVMDAWCALWFWPLTGDEVTPPTFAQWLDALQSIIGAEPKRTVRGKRFAGDQTLAPADLWESLADQESFALAGGNTRPIADVLDRHPWLQVCQRVADEQGFFHWPLEFAPVFAHGGFDLQVGNPPWVRPRGDVPALLAEGDPWWQLTDKPSNDHAADHRALALSRPGMSELVLGADTATVALASYVADATNYPVLAGLQPDLYRCFMATTWTHASQRGAIGLLHPETHFTDEKAHVLRAATYPRLRRHWQFINELRLFDEVHHLVSYGVHIYGAARGIEFLQASSLYHPETVLGSLRHNGDGPPPGLKHDGHWDLRPHAQRILTVTDATLETWRDTLEPQLGDPRRTRMVYTVNRDVAETLAILSRGQRLGSLGLQFSRGWDESIDRAKGRFVQRWGVPDSWSDVILQGPHIFVGTPLYKSPNPTMKSNKDWSDTDFETLAPDAIPATSYKPAGDPHTYNTAYTHWETPDGDPIAARDHYRLAWRAMAANTGERTLIPGLIPPGAAHVNGVFCVSAEPSRTLVAAVGFAGSLLGDFAIRTAPKSGIYQAAFERLPAPPTNHDLTDALVMRALRLNCVTDAYGDLWSEVYDPAFAGDAWTRPGLSVELGEVGPEWTAATPLRRAADRRQALVEIDALVALMLGVSADQLCTVYRTQFAVLYGYDHDKYTYDANGRLVPNPVLVAWRKKGERITEEERTHTNQAGNTYVYDLPFATRDREQDIRTAYAEFERRL